jgi:hypothetical protein
MRMVTEVPEELHEAFRLQCQQNGVTQASAVRDLLRGYLTPVKKQAVDAGMKIDGKKRKER